jgi:cell division protein FtsW (lipid II flippase)
VIIEDFWEWLSAILKTNLILRMGHLWFLLVLAVVVMGGYPLMVFSARRRRQYQFDFTDILLLIGQMIAPICMLVLSFVIIGKDKKPFWEDVVPVAMILQCAFLVFSGFQIFFQKYGQ